MSNVSDALTAREAVRADRHQIDRVVLDAMAWAAARPAPEGAIPSYQEWGNSLGEVEARRTADRILASLTPTGWQPIETISRAAQDVLAERQRQISVEGWDDTHDDCNDKSELAQAAACYALSGTPADEAVFIHGRWKDPRDLFWPWTWDRSWWKPTNRRRDLVKAGALILAEIERLDRAAQEVEGGSDER